MITFVLFMLNLLSITFYVESSDIDLILANIDNFQIPEIRNPKNSLHQVRGALNFTMEDNEKLVNRSGHKWCGLVRDKWACSGDHYENVLKSTPPFDSSLYNLSKIKPGTRIFADGNSFLAEFIYAIICEDEEDRVIWKIGNERGNSLLVYYNQSDVAILLLDNESKFSLKNEATVNWLRTVGYKPNLLIMGGNNVYKNIAQFHASRTSKLSNEFPHAILISWLYSHLPCGCASNFCGKGCNHQCFPGPFARNAEKLVARINDELEVYGKLV